MDVAEVIDAAASKPYGFMVFRPGPGVGGHCIPCDPHYLLLAAQGPPGARCRSSSARWPRSRGGPSQVVERAADVMLADHSRGAGRARGSWSSGSSYKPGVSDVRESSAARPHRRAWPARRRGLRTTTPSSRSSTPPRGRSSRWPARRRPPTTTSSSPTPCIRGSTTAFSQTPGRSSTARTRSRGAGSSCERRRRPRTRRPSASCRPSGTRPRLGGVDSHGSEPARCSSSWHRSPCSSACASPTCAWIRCSALYGVVVLATTSLGHVHRVRLLPRPERWGCRPTRDGRSSPLMVAVKNEIDVYRPAARVDGEVGPIPNLEVIVVDDGSDDGTTRGALRAACDELAAG